MREPIRVARNGSIIDTWKLYVAKTKTKLLPKNFEELLRNGDLEELKKVFETCDVNARGGLGKKTAIAFDECPDELARWLVGQGADLSATDDWGNTPLHARSRSMRGRIGVLLELGADINSESASIGTPLHAAASSHNPDNARTLVSRGASVDFVNREGLTPLELALRTCNNSDLERMARLAEILLNASSRKTSRTNGFVEEIGKRFEFSRDSFNPERVDRASAALERLYTMFEVPPVPRRRKHDGKSSIVVNEKTWQEQHHELWDMLVPSSGPAITLQGEVIRISGRISDELEGNGGINWDADFRKMAEAFPGYLQQGNPLAPRDHEEVIAVVTQIKRKSGDTARLCQLAVTWVLLNPTPLALNAPAYRR